MMDFIIYDVKVAALIAVFYAFFRLLLARETFHRFNRIVLVGTALLSFVLPLVVLTFHKTMVAASAIQEEAAALPESSGTAPAAPWWHLPVVIVFFAGMAFVLGKVLVSVIRVRKIIACGELVDGPQGTRLSVQDADIAPFSWMHTIVLSREDYDNLNEEIMAHECAHVRFGHSREVLLTDVLTALQWFNPMMWMLRSDLRSLHEYEADEAVVHDGMDAKAYQLFLIRKAAAAHGYTVANSFSYGTLKNRIAMLMKNKSSIRSMFKVLYLIPIALVSLGLNARTVYDLPAAPDSAADSLAGRTSLVDTLPGRQVVAILGQKHQQDGASAPVAVISGKGADVLYILDGRELSAKEVENLDPESIQSISVLKGEKARELYGSKAADGAVVISSKKSQDAVPYAEIEVKPQFNGGSADQFAAWAKDNLKFPEEAKAKKLQGRVMVQFTIAADGSVSNVKVLRGVDPVLDTEAVRVVSSSPKWTPGYQNGKAVPVTFVFPVVFNQ